VNLAAFLQTWRGVQAENRWHRLLVLVLVVTNLLAWVTASRREVAVVLTPPTLNEPVQVARRQADAGYKMTWGLFFAQLLGNVTPGTADLILPALEPLLAPAIYQPVRDAIAEQLAAFTREQLTTRFEPRHSRYDVASDTVYVTGVLITSGVSSTPQRSERTYELQIAVDDYRPRLMRISVNAGPPRPDSESRS